MNELIKLNYDTEQPTVSARELHEKLNIGTEFAKRKELKHGSFNFHKNRCYR